MTSGVSGVAWWALALLACSPDTSRGGPDPPKLRVALRGVQVPPLSLGDMRKLGDVRVSVPDPHEHRTIEVRAVPMARLLDAAFGQAWRREEEIVATCGDGFRPAIPVALFTEHEAYLAYARADAPDFAVQEDPAKRTPVGPYYLVWKEDRPEPQWPYQVLAFEATDYEARFAATVPPPDADPAARRGFERFRTVCLPCHTMNGRGGAVGPELNYPLSVTEYFVEPVLRRWLTDPQSVRLGSKMPKPFPPGEDEGRAIDEVVAYLAAMAKHKVAPPVP